MKQIENAAYNICSELYNICFRMPQYDYYNDVGKYLLDPRAFENALDTVQGLCDKYTKTKDPHFNKLTHKILATVASLLYFYYKKGLSYIQKAFYKTKFLLDIQSIYNVADFFNQKYVKGIDCYLVCLQSEATEVLQFFARDRVSNRYCDYYMSLPLCLLYRGEKLQVKRVTSKEYTSFDYNPTQLISTVVFSVSGNTVIGKVDNSMWSDDAWNL